MFGTPFKLRDPARGATADAILCVINSAGTPLWSTYYGATTYGLSNGNAVAFDSSGSVILVGQSASHDLPVGSGAAQVMHSPPDPDDDGFVAKFDANGRHVWMHRHLAHRQGHRQAKARSGSVSVWSILSALDQYCHPRESGDPPAGRMDSRFRGNDKLELSHCIGRVCSN